MKNRRESFRAWLTPRYAKNSGGPRSYIKAINLLSGVEGQDIFTTDDPKYLEDLYQD